MEFYENPAKSLSFISRVSIPNGMEFYAREAANNAIINEFQFPTGWNSTVKDKKYNKIVYSFNSQRDGILPLIFIFNLKHINVSIPNGMEFYLLIAAVCDSSVGFNSQRDGILLNR